MLVKETPALLIRPLAPRPLLPDTLFTEIAATSVTHQRAPFLLCALTITFFTLSACTPRIAVEAPKEPITINLNVKIDHEVRVKVEKDLEDVISKDSDLF